MLKVLLVEDHAMDVSLIRQSIDWDGLCLELVGIASNGQAALELAEAHQPDIIITDLVMPVKNGVAMAAEIRKKRQDVRIIFISGHERFDFAQSGIQSGIDAYLVKPILPERINSLLEQIVTEHIRRQRITFEQKRFKEQLETNMPMLRNHFLNQIISTHAGDKATLYSQVAFYKIPLKEKQLCALVFSGENRQDQNAQEETRQRSRFEIINMIGDLAARLNTPSTVFNDSQDNSVLLINCPEHMKQADLSDFAARVIQTLSLACSLRLAAGIGPVVNGYENLFISYSGACKAAGQKFFIGFGQVVFYHDIATEDNDAGRSMLLIERCKNEISEAVVQGNKEQVQNLLRQLHDDLIQSKLSPDSVNHIFVEIISSAIIKLSGIYPSFTDRITRYDTLYTFICGEKTLQAVFTSAQESLIAICDLITQQTGKHHSKIVSLVRQIVDSRYGESLTVDQIAENIHYSRGYASHVFRNETGDSIARYLLNKRIAEARKLLVQTEALIVDIAKKVGFDNASYFASVFKNETGLSPKEYRLQHESQDASCYCKQT